MSEHSSVPVSTNNLPPRTVNEDLSVVFLDQTQDARDFARDAADKRLTEELNEGGRFKRFVKGVWKGNIARDYYRQSYIQQAQEQITNEQDVLSHTSTTAERRADAIATTIDRFKSDNDDLIHEAAGEKRTEIAGNSEVAQSLKDIIRRYAGGSLTDETLGEEGKQAMKAYREANGDGEGLVEISNILEIAKAVKGKVEHGESLDNIITNMKVVAGEARTGARSEAKYDRVDSVINKIEKSKLRFIPKGAIVAGVTIASSLARLGSTKAINAAAMTVLPGVGAGIIAGIRERKRVKDERTQHSREMASGGQEIADNSKRRDQMEKTRYKTERAVDLSASLLDSHEAIYMDDSEREAGETKDGALQAALDALAAVQARNDMSDNQHIDLISYTDVASIGDERMQLDLARAQVKVALGQELDDATRVRLGLEPGVSINELIVSRADAFADINEDMSTKDLAFRKLRRRRALKVGAVTGATAIIGGLAAQEAIAALSDTREGLVEQLWNAQNSPVDGVDHQTVLHGLVNGDEGTTTVEYHPPSSDYTASALADHSSLSVSNETNFVNNGDGTFNLVGPTGDITAENVPMNGNGSLPQSSIDLLHSHGMAVEDTSYAIDLVGSETKTGGLVDYMEQYKGDTTHVTRDLWYDNDTTAYDKNELDLWRGGTNNNGINPGGGFQYSVASMSEDGSYNGDQAAHWKELAESGQLKVAISASVETQAQVFMVDINPDGTINIPPDSPASAFFAQQEVQVPVLDENGENIFDANGQMITEGQQQAVFTGQYMEIAQMTGADADAVEHIRPLATLVGNGEASTMVTTQEIPTHTPEPHFEYKITNAGYETTSETSTFTEMAPVLPVASRRAMETLDTLPPPPPVEIPRTPDQIPTPTTETPENGYDYNGRVSDARLERWRAESSPRLQADREAVLNPREELDFYYDQQMQRRGPEYINEINERINNSPELKRINADSRAIIAIPVHATGESENIYNTLSLYAQQDPESKQQATILMNLNWIEDDADDPEKKAKIDKTFAEIERARADFPDLNIATFTKTWKRDWYENVRKKAMYGEIIKQLYDTAAFATKRAIDEGRLPTDQDVLLVTNDADARGMATHYIRQLVKAETDNPETDAFVGAIRWGTKEAEDFPGYHISQLFMQAVNVASTRASSNTAAITIGPNSAFRMSAYAAVGGCEDRDDLGVGADSELGRRVFAARGGFEASGASGDNGYGGQTQRSGNSATRTNRRIIKHVGGAAIDTAPERLLNQGYRSGKWLPQAWGGFNDQTSRDQSVETVIDKEDPRKDFPAIQKRVESQIRSYIQNWYPDRALVSFTLSTLFPDEIAKDGTVKRSWVLNENRTGNGSDFEFYFTDNGSRRLQNSLLRDTKGKFDPLHNRLQRRLYGIVKPRAKKLPRHTTTPLVLPR